MQRVFGVPAFDENGEQLVTTYEGDTAGMLMDIRVYRLKAGDTRAYCFDGEETALLLFSGEAVLAWNGQERTVSRRDVFTEGPWALHVSTGSAIGVRAVTDCEFLVQRTHNDRAFPARLYGPADAPWGYSCVGKFGNVAKRRVNTIFDHDIQPLSNMVLGEVLNDRGNWSGYLPHRHPQPETYYFKFDRPEGFGASFVGDRVFKSVDGSFAAIPGGELHPQAVAPGFQMYTCWMIRHLDGNPWLQTDRCEDERYTWLHDASFE